MRSNFDELNPRRNKPVENSTENKSEYIRDTPPFSQDSEEETCLELLSAYIDGEVNASERRQVQDWLDNDPRIHQLYVRMLRLHQAINQIPASPISSLSSSQLSEQVFQRIDQQGKGRFLSLGVVVVGAICLGMLTGILVKGNSAIPKFAKEQLIFGNQNEQGLMIALNYPVMDIPTSSNSSKAIPESRK